MDPYESQYAMSACFGIGSYTFDVNPTLDFDPAGMRDDRYPVTDLKNHSWLGYKYFDFYREIKEGEQLYLVLALKECAVGTVNVYASDPKVCYSAPEQSRTFVGQAALEGTNDYREILVPVTSLSGKKAIYLEFCSETAGTVCELDTLRFVIA